MCEVIEPVLVSTKHGVRLSRDQFLRRPADLGLRRRDAGAIAGEVFDAPDLMEVQTAFGFANVLPIGLRTLFVTAWDTNEPIKPFEDREAMSQEVKSLRADHNVSGHRYPECHQGGPCDSM